VRRSLAGAANRYRNDLRGFLSIAVCDGDSLRDDR